MNRSRRTVTSAVVSREAAAPLSFSVIVVRICPPNPNRSELPSSISIS
jgi:hypothetical protein